MTRLGAWGVGGRFRAIRILFYCARVCLRVHVCLGERVSLGEHVCVWCNPLFPGLMTRRVHRSSLHVCTCRLVLRIVCIVYLYYLDYWLCCINSIEQVLEFYLKLFVCFLLCYIFSLYHTSIIIPIQDRINSA